MWRNRAMNDEKQDVIVEHMISYIEQIERDFQAANLTGNSKKSSITDKIIAELERTIENEDKKD